MFSRFRFYSEKDWFKVLTGFFYHEDVRSTKYRNTVSRTAGGKKMADNYEEVIMGLILNAGNAKSLAIEAYRKARSGQFDEADQLLKEADEAMTEAHHLQTSMIQDEINGHATPMTLLAVHAQDHTMTAMTVVDLVKEMVITIKEGK